MAETDEEQIEAIKTWWKENGKALVFYICLCNRFSILISSMARPSVRAC